MNQTESMHPGGDELRLREEACRLIEAVRRFADAVLDAARDRWGAERTPLFADGVHAETLEPPFWLWKEGRRWILSNLASQQSLLRLLDGLTALTGQPGYRAAAEDAAAFALRRQRAPSGLLYWGGHAAMDLLADEPCGTWYGRRENGAVCFNHELKAHQPYFELFGRVDASRAKDLMGGIWGGHVLDWRRLDFNRHAPTCRPAVPQWDADFASNIEVPFPSTEDNLSFCHVTLPLLRAAVGLAVLGGDDRPLTWAYRLARRWQQARDPRTGLCGGQLSYRRRDRAWEALGHVHPQINEAKIVASYHQTARYHVLPLAQMQVGAWLVGCGGAARDMGREFIAWASEDLLVYARRCYDASQRRFVAHLTDGTPLQWRATRTDYYRPAAFAPCRPDGGLFWGYALAYRLTGDREHGRMLAALAPEFGLSGWREEPAETSRLSLASPGPLPDWRLVYALLDMAQATGVTAYLEAAVSVARSWLGRQRHSGMFDRPPRSYPCEEAGEQIHHAVVPGTCAPGYAYGRSGVEVRLALLHLAAALQGRSAAMPPPAVDDRYFHCVYHGDLEPHQQKWNDERTYDWLVFYGED